MKIVYQILDISWNGHLNKSHPSRKIDEKRVLIATNVQLLKEYKNELKNYNFKDYISINSESEIKTGVATTKFIEFASSQYNILDSSHLGGKQSAFIHEKMLKDYVKL